MKRFLTAMLLMALVLMTLSATGATVANASTCRTATGTITYHDFGADIWSVSETAHWCYDGHKFASVSWSRSWARYDVAWSWCGWTASTHTSGSITARDGKLLHWKTWYSKGCFHDNFPPFTDFYPDITMQIYADGNYNCHGHAYDGASQTSCT